MIGLTPATHARARAHLQVQSRQQLINLLDLALTLRNLSFFMLVLFYLRRASILLEFVEKEQKVGLTRRDHA